MGTEAAILARVARAICDQPHFRYAPCDCQDGRCNGTPPKEMATASLEALGIPMSVLAWITANPEAAKGLASGEMVAVPKPDIRSPSTIEELEAILNSEDTAPVTITADGRVIAAASPPAPSCKAQGET